MVVDALSGLVLLGFATLLARQDRRRGRLSGGPGVELTQPLLDRVRRERSAPRVSSDGRDEPLPIEREELDVSARDTRRDSAGRHGAARSRRSTPPAPRHGRACRRGSRRSHRTRSRRRGRPASPCVTTEAPCGARSSVDARRQPLERRHRERREQRHAGEQRPLALGHARHVVDRAADAGGARRATTGQEHAGHDERPRGSRDARPGSIRAPIRSRRLP